MLATAREKRSIANTTLCCENSDTELSNDIVFLNVEFLRLAVVSMVTGGISWQAEMVFIRRIIPGRDKIFLANQLMIKNVQMQNKRQ